MKRNSKKKTYYPLPLFLFTLAVFLLTGCEDFSFYAQLDGEAAMRINAGGQVIADELVIIPESVIIPVSTSYTFSAEGGVPPYEFSISSGEGTIEADTGIYSSGEIPGKSLVQVTDAAGKIKEAEIDIIELGVFTISPVSITLYTNNTATFTALGGIKPYSFSVVSGSGTINAETGFYTAPGSAGADTVRVTDAQNNTSEALVTVLAPFRLKPSAIMITTTYSYTFSPTGGKPPYSFAVIFGDGTVNPDTGEYTAPATAGTDIVEASDSAGNSETVTITVVPPASLLISPSSAAMNTASTLFFSATGGDGDYTFSVYSGSGSIDSLTGEYTSPGSAGTDVVRVTDGTGAKSDSIVTIVSSGLLTINPNTAIIDQNTSYIFTAGGGTPPYTFAVTSGSGFINAVTGVYTAPAATGTAEVTVTDSWGASDTASIDIAPAAPTDLDPNGPGDIGPNTIHLTWTDQAEGEEGFKIERKIAGGEFIELIINPPIGPDETSYLDKGLNPTTVYFYRIRAYAGSIYSSYSEEVYNTGN